MNTHTSKLTKLEAELSIPAFKRAVLNFVPLNQRPEAGLIIDKLVQRTIDWALYDTPKHGDQDSVLHELSDIRDMAQNQTSEVEHLVSEMQYLCNMISHFESRLENLHESEEWNND